MPEPFPLINPRLRPRKTGPGREALSTYHSGLEGWSSFLPSYHEEDQTSSDPTYEHTPDFPLYTFPAFQNAPVGAHIQTLARPRQALHIAVLLPQHQVLNALDVHPDAARGLRDQLDLLQHALRVPVLQADPQPA